MALRNSDKANHASRNSASRSRSAASRRSAKGQKAAGRHSASHAGSRTLKEGTRSNPLAETSAKSFASTRRRTERARSTSNKSSAKASRSASLKRDGAALSLKERVFSSRIATVVVVAIALLLVLVLCDTVGNWGKAYGNVSINGMDVGGMTSEQIRAALDEKFGSKLAGSKVTIYASEEARARESEKYAKEEDAAIVEQISADEAKAKVTSWTADGTTLKAALPYDRVIGEAMQAGRKGGPFARIALAFGNEDVPLDVTFDENALETFAKDIDATVGDERQDATVEVQNGYASAVDGHDGNMVDRAWLAQKISDVILDKNGATYVIAEASYAPSRTTLAQAEALAEAVNRALAAGVDFSYKTTSWSANAAELGNWTQFNVVDKGDGTYDLQASIDPSVATAALVKHMSANADPSSAEGIAVDFEVSDGNVVVKTSGSAEIPEVVPAIESTNEALYGEGGAAWSSSPQRPSIEIAESSAPETLSFDQALSLGIITVIGEYTTEYANDEGAENRNHNIHLVSDIINDTVCEANGGTWSFNTHSGDTNLDPPFASAGSIVSGEYVDSIGGGICQVATTVFNAVYEAGLDVVERRNHTLYIASYPTGRDAGVSYPESDFVWENKLPSDVLLKVSYTDSTVTARLYSVYTGYKVESKVGEWEEGERYKTEFEQDDTLEKGDFYLKTVGEDGRSVSVYRTVKDKTGAIVSETDFSSNYDPKNEVYLVGPGTDTSNLQKISEQRINRESDEDIEEMIQEELDSQLEDEDAVLEESDDSTEAGEL